MPKMTKKGARVVTKDLDKIATLFQEAHAALGIPQHIAADFARRCDLLSDTIEKNAGLDPQDTMGKKAFDATLIGQEKAGPLEGDADESFMKGEFSQQENRELRERQQGGDLGAKANEAPQPPKAGVQAAYKALVAALKASNLSDKKAAAVKRALELATVVVTAKKAEDDEEEVEEVEEEVPAEKESGKKASHGYDLSL